MGFWGPIIASVAGSAVSTAMQSGNNSSGSGGYDVTTMPQYSFTEPRLQQTSDFVSSNLQRMSEGQLPAYYANARPQIRESMARPLRKTYYGTAGNRTGLVQDAISAGTLTGLKGKAALTPAMKVMQEYADKESAIDDYLAKMDAQIMERDAQLFPSLSMSMPAGPQSTTIPFYQPGTSTDSTAYNQVIGAGADALGQWINNLGSTKSQNYDYYASKGLATTPPAWAATTSQYPGYYAPRSMGGGSVYTKG